MASLSILAAFHGIVAVYFKENYNLFVTNTTHTILGSTVGFLLLLKAGLCYRHYSIAKQVGIVGKHALKRQYFTRAVVDMLARAYSVKST